MTPLWPGWILGNLAQAGIGFNLLLWTPCWGMIRSTRLRFAIRPFAGSSAVIRFAPYGLPDCARILHVRRVSAASAAFSAARTGADFSTRTEVIRVLRRLPITGGQHTQTLRSARRSVTVTPGSFPPDLLVRALVMLQQELLERLLPARRLRGQPRAVKRKMSNYQLKRAEHHAWPQPTHTGAQAILVTRPQPAGP